jgi:hypothetical protein
VRNELPLRRSHIFLAHEPKWPTYNQSIRNAKFPVLLLARCLIIVANDNKTTNRF